MYDIGVERGLDHLKLICALAMEMSTEKILQWCQGTVMKILKEAQTFVIVQIKWDKKCLREGDNETTCDKLMKSKWNSNEHQQGTWREDLHHMANTVGDL